MILALLTACRPDPGSPDGPPGRPPGPDETATAAHTGDDPALHSAVPSPAPCATLATAGAHGSPRDDAGSAIAGTADGGWVIGGQFVGELILGAVRLEGVSNSDGVVVRYGPSGDVVWARAIAKAGNDTLVEGVAVADDGDVIVVGSFLRGVEVGLGGPDVVGLVADGDRDGFLARFDDTGAVRHAVRFGSAARDEALAVALLDGGDPVVVGFQEGDATVGAERAPLPLASGSTRGGFVIRLDAAGAVTWVRGLGGPDRLALQAVAAHPTAGVAVGAALSGSGRLVLGPVTVDAARDPGALVRLTAAGEVSTGAALGGEPRGVALADDGAAWAGGTWSATAVFGRGEPGEVTRTTTARSDAWVGRFAPDGSLAWLDVTRSRSDEATGIEGVAAGPDGGLVAAGWSDGARFGEGTPTAVEFPGGGRGDAFLARWDADGAFACAAWGGGAGGAAASDLARAPDGRYLTVGTFQDELALGLGLPGGRVVPAPVSRDGSGDTWFAAWAL